MLFGGASGGGKSYSLLAAALQFIHVPGYAAILLRRTYADLNQPRALIPLAMEWLKPWLDIGRVKFSLKGSRFHFPNDATLSFGYLDNDRDLDQFQGATFQYIGVDELGQHPLNRYTYLFSRLRKPDNMACPLRMRASANPGGIGHEWIRSRFIHGSSEGRVFVPATLEDNPSLDRESYEKSLERLDPVTRAQLRHGDWSIRPSGNMFKREWFLGKIVPVAPDCVEYIRCWDLAGSKNAGSGDPDYAVGTKLGRTVAGDYVLMHIARDRGTPHDIRQLVRATAEMDGPDIPIQIEQEGGSAGLAVVEFYQRDILPEFIVRGEVPTGNKVTRATLLSNKCESGMVSLVQGAWNEAFLDELCAFPLVPHDDQVDATASAVTALTSRIMIPDLPVGFAPKLVW